jgi:hypothetical protein
MSQATNLLVQFEWLILLFLVLGVAVWELISLQREKRRSAQSQDRDADKRDDEAT